MPPVLTADPRARHPRSPDQRGPVPPCRDADADDAGAARLGSAGRRAQADRADRAADLVRADRDVRAALRARDALQLVRVLAAQQHLRARPGADRADRDGRRLGATCSSTPGASATRWRCGRSSAWRWSASTACSASASPARLLFASHVVGVQKDFLSAMFTDGQVTGATDGRYNVLLLGGDSGSDRWGLRPDSLSVASIDAETGETVLFGLPRNMLNFPFPKGSIMDEQFPDGYDCGSRVRAELAGHVGRRPQEPVQGLRQPRCRGHQGRRRGHHRAEDQLLRDGEPAGLPEAGQRRRRRHPQRARPDPDRRHRRPDLGLHRARQAQAQRLRDAVVRPLARGRRRLLADGAPEVRDERDAPPAQPARPWCSSSRRSPRPARP